MSNQWSPTPSPMPHAALLREWLEAVKNSADAKTAELELRNVLLKAYFPHATEGTENFDLDGGYKLKGTFRYSYTVNKDIDKVDEALAKLEKSSKDGKFIAERLIRWEPNLSIREWKQLSEIHRKIMEPIVTIKPGQASLEFVSPKGVK